MELLIGPDRTARARIRFTPYLNVDDTESGFGEINVGDDRELLAHGGIELVRANPLERLAMRILGLEIPDRRRAADAALLDEEARGRLATAPA